MFLTGPDLLPDRAARLARRARRPGVHGARRAARPVRPALPAGRAARHRDERAADLAGVPARCCPALRRYGRSRLVTGAALATLVVVLVNLMHFSQGWVQFGYRFSHDAAPFALVLVALGLQSLVDARPALGDAAGDDSWSSSRSRSTRGA